MLEEDRFITTHLLGKSWDVQYRKIKLSARAYLFSGVSKVTLYRRSQACAGVCASERLSIAGGGVLPGLDEY